jgi:hypothetical protein
VADLFRIRIDGAGANARAFTQAQRRLQNAIIRNFRELGAVVEQEFAAAAPEDTGRLRGRVHAFVYFGRPSQPQITVRTFARDPDSGYAYVNVTRFGHRKAVIVARRAPKLAVHYAGHRNPHIVAFVDAVRGYRPTHDWAEDAAAAASRSVDHSATRLGRAIEAKVL